MRGSFQTRLAESFACCQCCLTLIWGKSSNTRCLGAEQKAAPRVSSREKATLWLFTVLPNNPKKCILFMGLVAKKVSRYSRQRGEGVPYLRQEQEPALKSRPESLEKQRGHLLPPGLRPGARAGRAALQGPRGRGGTVSLWALAKPLLGTGTAAELPATARSAPCAGLPDDCSHHRRLRPGWAGRTRR